VHHICHGLYIDCHQQSHLETMLKYLQNVFSGISRNVYLFLLYCKSHRMSRILKFIPFSTTWNVFGQYALRRSVTTQCLKALLNSSSRMATIDPTGFTIFQRCYDGKWMYFIWSQQSGFAVKHWIRTPLANGTCIQKASSGGLSCILYIITYLDTSHQLSD